HALQMRELLVEVAAQPIELLRLAQILGRDRLVVLGDEGPVIRPAWLVLAVPARTPRLGRSLGVGHLGVGRHLGGERGGGRSGGVGHALAGGVGFIDPRLRVLGVALAVLAGLFLAAILLALLAFLLVGFGAAVFAHVERVEEIVDGVAEACLVLDQPL